MTACAAGDLTIASASRSGDSSPPSPKVTAELRNFWDVTTRDDRTGIAEADSVVVACCPTQAARLCGWPVSRLNGWFDV
jgi:hypothetical protein